MQRNLPNPEQLFADPNYKNNSKISQQEMEALMNKRPDFTSNLPPPQTQKFDDVYNAKNFQIQSLINDFDSFKESFKNKFIEFEKRLQIINNSGGSQQTVLQGGFQLPQTSNIPRGGEGRFTMPQTSQTSNIPQQGGFQPFRAY